MRHELSKLSAVVRTTEVLAQQKLSTLCMLHACSELGAMNAWLNTTFVCPAGAAGGQFRMHLL